MSDVIRKGFSLIELIISLGILSVGLAGAMRVFPVGLSASKRSEMVSRAMIAAGKTMDTLKLESWDNITGVATNIDGDFEVITSVEAISLDGIIEDDRVKVVDVVVQWEQGSRTREIGLVTYVRRDDSQ